MFEYNDAHFQELCRQGPVSAEINAVEEKRKAAVRGFWLYLIGGFVLAAAILTTLIASDWPTAAIVIAVLVLVAALILALRPLSRVGLDLKTPVLETLAGQGGMTYMHQGFDPPVYPDARRILFGRSLSGQAFTDLFHGTDPDGNRFAIYEATLTRRAGKSTVTVFSGQVYAFQRRSKGGGETAIVPDRGLFNFFKPAKGMERLKFETDPEFEKKFEVYSTHPASALGLIGSDVRRALLELRQAGRVFAYVGPEDVLVAATGKDRFEAGSMFRSSPGQERARAMFDDLCASLAVLRRLKRALD